MMNDNILVQFKISNHKLLIEQGRYQIDHLSPATTPTTATTDTTRTTDTTATTPTTATTATTCTRTLKRKGPSRVF